MAVLTLAQLKALWVKGFKPTSTNYADMFDSLKDLQTDSTLIGAGTMASPLSVKTNIIRTFIVPSGTNGPIDITTDDDGNQLNITDGSSIEIIVQVKAWAGGDLLNGLGIRPNNITSNVYVNEASLVGAVYPHRSTRKTLNSIIRITLLNGELIYTVNNSSITSTDTYEAILYRGCTIGANILSITSFNIGRISAGSQIPAGATIIIKKL